MRFLYEFFLEFCIVVMLQLSVVDFSQFSPGFQYIFALAVLLAAVALVAFLGFLFFRMGPWVPGFYKKGTSATSVN